MSIINQIFDKIQKQRKETQNDENKMKAREEAIAALVNELKVESKKPENAGLDVMDMLKVVANNKRDPRP